MKRLLFCLGLAVLLLAETSLAAPVFYLNDPVADRTAFQTAVSGSLSLESFENPFGSSQTLTFFATQPGEFTVSNDTFSLGQRNNLPRLVSHGTSALAFEEYPSCTVTFTFKNPIKAFGLNINDMNFGKVSYLDNLGNSYVDVLEGDLGSQAGGPGYENIQFFGVINPVAFDTIQFSFINTSASTGTLTFDYLEFSAVPEPATLSLLALGAVLLRRRRNP